MSSHSRPPLLYAPSFRPNNGTCERPLSVFERKSDRTLSQKENGVSPSEFVLPGSRPRRDGHTRILPPRLLYTRRRVFLDEPSPKACLTNPRLGGSGSPSKSLYGSQSFWLALYFFFNLSLTLYNKSVLVQFPFPYTLTALHTLSGSVGGFSILAYGTFTPARLSTNNAIVLVAFSALYAVNIVVSNISLQLVTVPFHQVVRAATPLFTIALSTSLLGTQCNRAKVISLMPVVFGVGLATYGDYYFTLWGFLLTLLGTLLAALKTIYTNVLQSSPIISPSPQHPKPYPLKPIPPRLQLHPLDLLTRMAPLAFIQCVIYAQLTGELDRVWHYSAHKMTPLKALSLFVNGCIAFGLNIVSFTANKKAGPLSMTVAANVKQVLTILLAVVVFDLTITWTNALGILFTLSGGAWYAWIEYKDKKKRSLHTLQHSPLRA